MTTRTPSLKSRLIVRLLIFQIGILLIFSAILVAFVIRADEGSAIVDPQFTNIAAQSIERGQDGRLHLLETPQLLQLKAKSPDLWFIARSATGEVVSFGEIPEPYRVLAHRLDSISFADIRDTKPPFQYIAVIRRVSAPAGEFTVLGKGTLFSMAFVVLFLSNLMMVPFLGLLALITMIATPIIVRREFRQLSVIAEEAGQVDIERRGVRLSSDDIPSEIVPLVASMNGALRRLDDGYDRHQRFLVDAAHELRTPIAVLQAKLEASPETSFGVRLQHDVARLATLAEQMLDLQRLDRADRLVNGVDLAEIAADVVADLAPLVVALGSELEVLALDAHMVRGDRHAIGRALSNLIQNGVEHGGRRIIVRVLGSAIEVEDDGPGIPHTEKDRIFEPFHRLQSRSTGSGLGLNLVRQIILRHGGTVEALDAEAGGTIMRIEFAGQAQR